MEMIQKISIRPGVSILSILKHIEYDPWYALAEFVDNAIDSYLKYEKQLKEIEGESFQLIVKIEFNEVDKKITIKDNAAGIHQKDYPRAFRAAEIPPDNSGLSESTIKKTKKEITKLIKEASSSIKEEKFNSEGKTLDEVEVYKARVQELTDALAETKGKLALAEEEVVEKSPLTGSNIVEGFTYNFKA